MHFLTIVVVPPGYDGDTVEYVTKALAPFDEQLEVESYTEDGETYWHNPQGFWDWYQIGGRWTGHLIPGYDPDDDLRNNWQVCDTCGGTGTRPGGREQFGAQWFVNVNGCNGCMGKGRRMKWPGDWVAPEGGNIARLGDVREVLESSGMQYLIHEGVDHARHDVTLAKLSDDCTVVVVDTHC